MLRSAAAGASGVLSGRPCSALLLELLLGLLLRLGGALGGLLEALLRRRGGGLGAPAPPVADRRLALGVDGSQQQPAEEAGVLQQVRDLPEALGRVLVL